MARLFPELVLVTPFQKLSLTCGVTVRRVTPALLLLDPEGTCPHQKHLRRERNFFLLRCRLA